MSNASTDSVWYGMLETSKFKTVVIRDDSLPENLSGRIYLYNADRDQIVEYVESIVNPKLRPLTDKERSEAVKACEKKFKATRKKFLSEHSSRSNILNLKSEAAGPVAKSKELIDDDVDVDLDDELDDEWDDDDEEMSA
ncbi:MAG: hypothetical protein KDJ38_07255 [Gammaproteobacteria bacterium]|nr:hypothetical protein [Gammaproteobacteria bacterium]